MVLVLVVVVGASRERAVVKVGESSVVRCPTGSAVKTPAGLLEADFVVHAVAPDVELTYGRYQGRTGAPEDLLRSAYCAAFEAAGDVECVACPALGAGVKGWDPAVTAAFGLEAAARAVLDGAAPRQQLVHLALDGRASPGVLAAARYDQNIISKKVAVVEQQRDGPRRFRRVEAVEVERAGPLRRVERREVGRYPVRREGRRDGVDV